jgi:phosphate transport system protein
MGRSDDKQIANAIEALSKRDAELARSVIAADDLIDAQQRAIEEKAIATIARRQPMAVDLREIVGALRICNDLERVGDLAENIAKRVLLLKRAFRIGSASI